MIFQHADVVKESAAVVLAAGDRALRRFEGIWQTARDQEDLMGILAARSHLLDYMAAGDILDDHRCYKAACDALLDRAEAFTERFQPANEILLVELSLAIIAGRLSTAEALAQALRDRPVAGVRTFESYQARSLAALLDPNTSVVQQIAASLIAVCEDKAFNKPTRSQARLWAAAVQHIAVGDRSAAEPVVQELRHLHIKCLEQQLAKLKRGAESAFAPFDMLDLPTAALLSLHAPEGADRIRTSHDGLGGLSPALVRKMCRARAPLMSQSALNEIAQSNVAYLTRLGLAVRSKRKR